MKTMTCNQLGGACEQTFSAETFEEISEMSKKHGMEMFQKGDEAHLAAMRKMKALSQDPGAVTKWFQDRKKDFDAMPED